MTSPVWHLDAHRAQLTLGQLAAAIDLGQPANGLGKVRFAGQLPEPTRLLGIHVRPCSLADNQPPADCYVRGADLVAAYTQSELWPVQLDVLWRAATPSEAKATLATLELLVSVRTDLLQTRAELSVQSALPADDVLRLLDPDQARFETVQCQQPRTIEPTSGSGCLLFRLAGSQLSYAETVHPLDFSGAQLHHDADRGRVVRVRHRLFPSPLEKGVMLRARVRGILMPRDGDAKRAAECYGAFEAEEPPLGA